MATNSPAERGPGWLKESLGFSKVAKPHLWGPDRSQFHQTPSLRDRVIQERKEKPSKEQIEAQRLEENAQFFQKEREIRDTAAKLFYFREAFSPPGGFASPEDEKAFENEIRIIADPRLAESIPPSQSGELHPLQLQAEKWKAFGEKDLAEMSYVFDMNNGGFVPAGSGRGTDLDVDIARQALKRQTKIEDAYTSKDPLKIKQVEKLDSENFLVGGLEGMDPAELDKMEWRPDRPREGVMSMIDYSGGQQYDPFTNPSDIGGWKGLKMKLSMNRPGQSPAEKAKLLNHLADNDLKVGNFNGYEKRMKEAWDLAQSSGDKEVLEWMKPKMDSLGSGKARNEFRAKTWADKFKEDSPDYSTPPGYRMPPRPPEAEYPAAAAWWDHIEMARDYGAKVPYIWSEKRWGETPKPIAEYWQEWKGTTTDPATGEITYDGARTPEHQVVFDRQEARRKKDPKHQAAEAHDAAAEKYRNEMIDPAQDLRSKYFAAEDPEEKERIAEEIERVQYDQNRGPGTSKHYEFAAEKDRLQVAEWDQQQHQHRMDYWNRNNAHLSSGGRNGSAASPGGYKNHMDQLQEPPEIAEARKRVQERQANSKTLNSLAERGKKALEQETAQRQEFEDAVLEGQIAQGNNHSAGSGELELKVREAGGKFEAATRNLRVRAQQAAQEGKIDEAADLMARRDYIMKDSLTAAADGEVNLDHFDSAMKSVVVDSEWEATKKDQFSNPVNREYAEDYVKATETHKQDFTSFYSKDPGEQLKAMRAQVARFDTGKPQEPRLTPEMQEQLAGRDPATLDQPAPAPGEQPAPAAQPPAAPVQPPATPQDPSVAQQPPAQQPPTQPAAQPASWLQGGHMPKPINNSSRELSYSDSGILPERLRPNNQPSRSTSAGSAPGPAIPPPAEGITPGAPPIVQGQQGQPQGGQPDVAQKPGSAAPSNAAQAGLKPENVPQVGTNRKAPTGNALAFTGVGANRVSGRGLSPNQTANFTVGGETRTLNTKLFPDPSKAYDPNQKLSNFRGGHFAKRAAYIKHDRRYEGLEKLPLLGGMLRGTVVGVEDAMHWSGRGELGRAAAGAGNAALNAGLMVGSVTGTGAIVRGTGRLALKGGRSIFARATAKEMTPIQARGSAAKGLKPIGQNLDKATVGKTLRTGAKAVGAYTGAVALESASRPSRWDNWRMAQITPTGQNTSLLDKVRSGGQVSSGSPAPGGVSPQPGRIKTLLD